MLKIEESLAIGGNGQNVDDLTAATGGCRSDVISGVNDLVRQGRVVKTAGNPNAQPPTVDTFALPPAH